MQIEKVLNFNNFSGKIPTLFPKKESLPLK